MSMEGYRLMVQPAQEQPGGAELPTQKRDAAIRAQANLLYLMGDLARAAQLLLSLKSARDHRGSDNGSL